MSQSPWLCLSLVMMMMMMILSVVKTVTLDVVFLVVACCGLLLSVVDQFSRLIVVFQIALSIFHVLTIVTKCDAS
jgi:hypothetical protein